MCGSSPWRPPRSASCSSLKIARGLILAAAIFGLTACAPHPQAKPDVIVGPQDWLFPGWVTPLGDRPGRVWLDAKRIGAIHDRLARRGTTLVVVLVPSKARAEAGFLPEGPQKTAATTAAYDDLVTSLRGRSIMVIDAMPLLDPTRAFQRHDTHWAPSSSEVVAGVTADKIRAAVALPAPGAGQQVGDWQITRQDGDLTLILRREGWRRTQPTEAFRSPSYTPSSIGPAAVYLVGNSYTDRSLGFPQALSHRLGLPVHHLLQYGDSGTWQAMAAYLKSPPSAPPPRVLVWVLNEGALATEGPQRPLLDELDEEAGVPRFLSAIKRRALSVLDPS